MPKTVQWKQRFVPLNELTNRVQVLLRTRLWAQVVAGMVLGVLTGLIIDAVLSGEAAQLAASWFALPGKVFLALIQMVMMPLIVSSIILGISSSGSMQALRSVGWRAGVYFLATTILAVVIGIILATSLQPGSFVDRAALADAVATTPAAPLAAPKPIPERIAEIIPNNPLAAALEQGMLQIVIFSLLIGIAIVSIPRDRGTPVISLCYSLQDISMKVVSWAMRLAPIAVYGLLTQITARVGLDVLLSMSAYVGTVLVGLLILVVMYLVIVWRFAGWRPLAFLSSVRETLLLAFSTSSSAAVMPLSMQTAQEKLKVGPALVKFIIPLGATANMAGTALYQVVAAVFLTQVFGVDLSLGGLILLSVTTVAASIGSPSTPGVGIVILATILRGIGVPPAGSAIIVGVDRILDMSRTSVNVLGDLSACVVVDKWMGDEVSASEPDPQLA